MNSGRDNIATYGTMKGCYGIATNGTRREPSSTVNREKE